MRRRSVAGHDVPWRLFGIPVAQVGSFLSPSAHDGPRTMVRFKSLGGSPKGPLTEGCCPCSNRHIIEPK